MPSGWDVYYIVFLSAFLALMVPAFLGLISRVMASRRVKVVARAQAGHAPNARSALGQRINARFFLAANSALILITLMLALVPCVGLLQRGDGEASNGRILMALVATVSITVFAAIGLLYAARKGDLSWLKSFQPARPGETEKKGN